MRATVTEETLSNLLKEDRRFEPPAQIEPGSAMIPIPGIAADVVTEAAVVGAKDEDTGQAVCAFVILRESALDSVGADGGPSAEQSEIVEELRNHVRKEIGPIAKPRQIMIVPEHREVGDVTTLADSTVMDLIKQHESATKGED